MRDVGVFGGGGGGDGLGSFGGGLYPSCKGLFSSFNRTFLFSIIDSPGGYRIEYFVFLIP